VNCREVQDHLGDAIDRELPADLREEFYRHLELCPPCRSEYEMENLGKAAVHRFVCHLEVPPTIYRTVVDHLHKEFDTTAHEHPEGWLTRLWHSRLFIPAAATGLAALAAVLVLLFPSLNVITQQVNTADLMSQIRENFSLIRKGEMKPAMVAYYPDRVAGYFRESGTPFPVSVLSHRRCDWYGATSNQYGNIPLAHVVYQIGNDLMYVYQVGQQDAMDGSVLTMPEQARVALVSTGWYSDSADDNCTIVMWTTGITLCGAASTLKKDQLMDLLAEK
jgi:anti-sigma factor (TIGR02949 family)